MKAAFAESESHPFPVSVLIKDAALTDARESELGSWIDAAMAQWFDSKYRTRLRKYVPEMTDQAAASENADELIVLTTSAACTTAADFNAHEICGGHGCIGNAKLCLKKLWWQCCNWRWKTRPGDCFHFTSTGRQLPGQGSAEFGRSILTLTSAEVTLLGVCRTLGHILNATFCSA